MNLSAIQEDYIKIIWNLEQKAEIPRPSSMAEIMNVKPPTVISMFKQLQRLRLISYDKKHGVLLTTEGKIKAEKLVRKHRLLETFLEKVLEIEDPVLHDEAEKLEHAISDQLTIYIDRYLDFPRFDPHGEIIPLADSDEHRFKLSDIDSNIEFKVSLIPMGGDYGEYCIKNSIIPGSRWRIIDVGPNRETFLINSGNKNLPLSKEFAEKIHVTIKNI